MSDAHDLFLECYKETEIQFPGSSPHTLKELATRLYESLMQTRVMLMSRREVFKRCSELGTALQTIPQWPGLNFRDGRSANAED